MAVEEATEALTSMESSWIEAARLGSMLGAAVFERARPEVDATQGEDALFVGALVERIQVFANRTAEQDRILRDNGEAASQIFEADLADVDTVNDDGPFVELHKAEESKREGTLS